MGRNFYYLPRRVQKLDLVLGEDVLSKFDTNIQIEMYMREVNGYSGEKELYSKFGLEINSSYTLVVSKSRWEAETIKPANAFMLVKDRPQEGDLIYDPLTKMIFEIKWVDHDAEFYQVGKNYTYELSCEAFQYSSEQFNTGISDVDGFDSINSLDILNDQMMKEDGGLFLLEQGGSLILDTNDNSIFDPGFVAYDRSETFEEESIKVKTTIFNPFA